MPERLIAAAWRVSRAWPLLLISLLSLNAGLYAWINFRVSPEVSALERRYIDTQMRLRQAAQRQERLASPQERLRQAQTDLQTFRQAIPPGRDFTALIQEVFTLAENSGLSIERINYDPKNVTERDLLRYTLNFSVGGNYGQIKKFIAALEQSPRIIAIEEISLSGSEHAQGEAVSLRIRLSTYFQSDFS